MNENKENINPKTTKQKSIDLNLTDEEIEVIKLIRPKLKLDNVSAVPYETIKLARTDKDIRYNIPPWEYLIQTFLSEAERTQCFLRKFIRTVAIFENDELTNDEKLTNIGARLIKMRDSFPYGAYFRRREEHKSEPSFLNRKLMDEGLLPRKEGFIS